MSRVIGLITSRYRCLAHFLEWTDPYLEGYLWPDVYHRLATQISDQLMPLMRPRYVARIEVQVVTDEIPEAEIGIMYPDVEIVRTPRQPEVSPPPTKVGLIDV